MSVPRLAVRPASLRAARSRPMRMMLPLSAVGGACRQCRRQQLRLYSAEAASASASTSTPVQAPPPPPAAGIARLHSRRLISVAGPDAAKYLHGVITTNLPVGEDGSGISSSSGNNNNRRAGLYAAFLNAQGRVLHDVFVYRDTLLHPDRQDGGSSFLVEVDADDAAALQRHIRRYKLRAKFEVRLLPADELGVWQVWGGTAPQPTTTTTENGRIVLPDTRAPGLGWRVIGQAETGDGDVVPESSYLVRRFLLGVPEGPREVLHGTALPLESNMDAMGGIDYRKGCYVGQELTIRTKHRGVVRKRILPCLVYSHADVLPPTALVYAPEGAAGAVPPTASIGRVGKKGRSAGKWLRGVGNLGLALCRLETMTDVVLPGETGAATPFDPASEFAVKLSDDGDATVKVKAFVPDWLRQTLQPPE